MQCKKNLLGMLNRLDVLTQISIAPDRTHHIYQGKPLYNSRYKWVEKFRPPGLAVAQDELGFLHISLAGEPAYSQRFIRTYGFYEGIASVHSEEGWFHIQPDGTPLYPERYAWAGNFREGRCVVQDAVTKLFLHIDQEGRTLYPPSYTYAGDFYEGYAVVRTADGLYTHIGLGGELLHERYFLDLGPYHKGYATARDERGWFHLTLEGKPAYKHRFAAIEPFYNGRARAIGGDGTLYLITPEGQILHSLEPSFQESFLIAASYISSYWKSLLLLAGVQKNLFEVHELSPVPSNIWTKTLLHALAEMSLIRLHGEKYELTPMGRLFHSEHPYSLKWAVLELTKYSLPSWLHKVTVSNEEPLYPDYFEQLSSDQERLEIAQKAFAAYALYDYPRVLPYLPLPPSAHVIDAGGGLGILAKIITSWRPDVTVTILERPEVVSYIREKALAGSSVIRFKPCDILQDWQEKSDIVILARVLHNWPDNHAIQILRNARKALSQSKGKLVILEYLLGEDFSGSALNMHMRIICGGQERTLQEYQRILSEAGMTIHQVISREEIGGVVSMIIATPLS